MFFIDSRLFWVLVFLSVGFVVCEYWCICMWYVFFFIVVDDLSDCLMDGFLGGGDECVGDVWCFWLICEIVFCNLIFFGSIEK